MGVLDKYSLINNYGIDAEPYKPYIPPPVTKREYVVPEVIPVTVAELDSRSKNFVTAHDLRDYRRTSFNLVMLPAVTLSYDAIAKEVYGLGEYL